MFAAFLSLAMAAQAAPSDEMPSRSAPGAVLARVAACGVKRREVHIRADDTLQEAVVDIRLATTPSDTQLTCLAQASAETYWFLVFDAATQARFEPLYSRVNEAVSLARAQAWVAAHGLASRVPHHDVGRDDRAATAARIEALCGAPSGSFHDLFLPDPTKPPVIPRVSDETWLCVLNVAAVAGLNMGLIGNEAAAPEPPR
ncbi:MAG: hypothetical protein V4475_07910 [Pseudomonadota bacterium]